MPKNIVICDDHILFSSGLIEILKSVGNDYNFAALNDSESCKDYINKNKVDVFICDLNIDNYDGFLLIEELKDRLKKTKIIILSAYFEDFLIQKAKKSGIHAFLKKETTAKELISVIESRLSAPFYANKMLPIAKNKFFKKDEKAIIKFKLSNQEKELIKLVVEGKTSREISVELNISKNTVDTHRKNIHKKLELTNSGSLIKFANENNLFP
ncbi:CitB Response regulator containing a CheY-like receiver domain and an HTH DNA-binding domain [Flavobacteriaceae bacterium]